MKPMMACGTCFDEAILNSFPFVFYWLIVLFFWSLVVGMPLCLAALLRKETLPMRPPFYFLSGILLGFIANGSLVLGMFIVALVAFYRMSNSLGESQLREIPDLGTVWLSRRLHRIVLTVCLLAIPLGYARRWVQNW